MKVIFACAGTGGHVNPAIAMAQMIQKREPKSQFLFIGTEKGLENKLVKKAGFEIAHIRTGKLIRSFTLQNVKAFVHTYQGIGDARKLVASFAPDIIIGTGGYICMPVMLAANKLKIPYVLHESNAFPGISVKLLAKKAKAVMLGFEAAKDRLPSKVNTVYTGTPAKFDVASFDGLSKEACQKEMGLSSIHKKIVLVTCGSQGAKKINETILSLLEDHVSQEYFFVLVTGENTYEEIKKRIEALGKQKNINMSDYIKVEKFVFEMEKMYKSADMCITRAGAMTITELAITGKPAILIPLPSAAENHQFYNAKVLENAGAGKIIEQANLTTETLEKTMSEMLDSRQLEKMGKQARTVVIQNVESNIYRCIKESK